MTNPQEPDNSIDRIEAMKEHLEYLKQNYVDITSEIFNVDVESLELSTKISDLDYSLFSPFITRREEPSPRDVKKLVELREDAGLLRDKKEQLLTRSKDLNELIRLQDDAIRNDHLSQSVTLEDVVKHQEEIGRAKAEVDRLNKLIDGQNQTHKALLVAQAKLEMLYTTKEDILADIAIGGGNEKELLKINKQLVSVLDTHTQATIACQNAEATKAGLSRKLDDALQALSTLENRSPFLIECLLHGMANEAGRHYFKAAYELKQAFIRLQGLNAVMQHYSPSRRSIYLDQDGLRIPGFNLDVATQWKHQANNLFFDWDVMARNGGGARVAKETILQELKNADITII